MARKNNGNNNSNTSPTGGKSKGRSKSSRFPQNSNRSSRKIRGNNADINNDISGVDNLSGGEYNATSKRNDVSWYSASDQLLKDVGSLPYGVALGARVDQGVYAGTAGNGTSIPGIMAIYTSPTIGNANSSHDPINIASRNIYTAIRQANSGAKNYDSVDLMLYLLAMDSVISCIEYCKRTLRLINTSNLENWYYPTTAIYASGFDMNDLKAHIADFRTMINYSISRISKFAVPKSLAYVARHAWMYSGIYLDDPNIDKAQSYMFVPEGFYKYALDSENKGCLVWCPITHASVGSQIYEPQKDITYGTTSGITFNEMRDYLDDMISRIVSSQDMATMNGDIIKALGTGNVYTCAMIGEFESITPVYMEELLDQINNLELVGRKTGPNYEPNQVKAGYGVFQVLNSMKEGDYLSSIEARHVYLTEEILATEAAELMPDMDALFNAVYRSNRLLNFTKQDPTAADNMVATRLIARASNKPIHSKIKATDNSYYTTLGWGRFGMDDTIKGFNWEIQLASCGSDTANFAKIFYASFGPGSQGYPATIRSSEDIYSLMMEYEEIAVAGTVATTGNFVRNIGYTLERYNWISNFNRAPMVSLNFACVTKVKDADGEVEIADATATEFTVRSGNIANYTTIDEPNLDNFHKVALMSMVSLR